MRGSGRARGRRQLRAIAAIHIRLPEERVGGSCSVFFFFSSRHAAFARSSALTVSEPVSWSPPTRLTALLPPPLAAQPSLYNQQTVPRGSQTSWSEQWPLLFWKMRNISIQEIFWETTFLMNSKSQLKREKFNVICQFLPSEAQMRWLKELLDRSHWVNRTSTGRAAPKRFLISSVVMETSPHDT